VLAGTASSAGVTMYVLQPEYGAPAMVEGGADTREQLADHSNEERGPTAAVPSSTRFANEMISATETTAALLSEKTGGKWFRGDGEINDAFSQVAADVLSYYSLAFRASDDLDRPRRIEVRLKNHPELRVRTRAEVVRKSIRREMNDRVAASLLYPRESNELEITVKAKDPVSTVVNRYTTTIDVLIPLANLTFLPEGDVYRARFTVHYAASGASTDFVSGEAAEQVVTVPAAEMEDAREKHWRYTAVLQTSEPNLRVAIGVLDSTSRLSGFQTTEVAAQ
jgi:hypothetical protein